MINANKPTDMKKKKKNAVLHIVDFIITKWLSLRCRNTNSIKFCKNYVSLEVALITTPCNFSTSKLMSWILLKKFYMSLINAVIIIIILMPSKMTLPSWHWFPVSFIISTKMRMMIVQMGSFNISRKIFKQTTPLLANYWVKKNNNNKKII